MVSATARYSSARPARCIACRVSTRAGGSGVEWSGADAAGLSSAPAPSAAIIKRPKTPAPKTSLRGPRRDRLGNRLDLAVERHQQQLDLQVGVFPADVRLERTHLCGVDLELFLWVRCEILAEN